ncbi:riboflavin synthase [Oceanimonas baumannii]|uniref:Riboflavin synthase n=1 Tax=Oceanimonas baumannii TaxID=129578 RepID=A0A235CDB5_9GAMM|nr:riboflavin synthase [Oceanimonas baumannii]OYD22608.1 riboflavin synthase [Oceanimonas baumannii]TDW57636.1 riboflavin synthase alpha chain [Oceanimonas baumannii]
MFTGIVEATGTLAAIERKGASSVIRIHCPALDLSDVALGDSIATNGVCLTVTELGKDYYCADVSVETLNRTGFADYRSGQAVNLEKALLPTTRLGGHLVSGHVDGVGHITKKAKAGFAIELWIEAPAALSRYIAEKGSITVDGISLTVNTVQGAAFKLTLVPHTLNNTTLNDWQVGRSVNLEVDLIARYLERLLSADKPDMSGGLTLATLAASGFVK